MIKALSKSPSSNFIFFAAILGNILEYYDFTVYSVFLSDIGRTFFPNESELSQMLVSLAAFAVGFLTRPLGGIFFGYIGDRYGRRLSLILSMLGMTLATFIIGFIPSYQDIGICAPILLVVMRLLQGLCVSGEGTGTAIFVLEHKRTLKPGLSAGIVNSSNIAGTLLASLVGIIIEQYYTGITSAWRGAFILGGILGLTSFYLRLKVAETPVFSNLVRQQVVLKAPFSHVLKTSKHLMFLTFCVGAIASIMVYLVKTYVLVFYSSVLHFPQTTSLLYLSYASFILMISMPVFGWLSDIVGKFRILVWSSIAILLLSLPIILLMASQLVWQQISALTILGIITGALSGVAYIFVISLFAPEQRFSGVAFSYNLGVAVFGGNAPFISRLLIEQTGLFYAPAFYVMFTIMIFLWIIYKMRGTISQALSANLSALNAK